MKVAGLMLAIGIFAFTTNAQTTTAPATQTVITNSAAASASGVVGNGTSNGGAVRLIDNKGTIKYLQVQNGITQITKATASGVTTTWQLGGTLTDNTYIDAAGKVFALDNLQVVAAGTAAAASATAVHGASNPAGWTMLVHDEVTGEVKKMLFTDLLQVQAGETTKTADASFITTPTVATGATTLNAADYAKVSVYRNGAKLLANVDYTVLAGVVTLVPNSSSTNAEWALYAGDIIEIHWVK